MDPEAPPWKLKARKSWKGKKIWLQWRLVFRMSYIVLRIAYNDKRLTAENAKNTEKILEKSKMNSRERGNDNL